MGSYKSGVGYHLPKETIYAWNQSGLWFPSSGNSHELQMLLPLSVWRDLFGKFNPFPWHNKCYIAWAVKHIYKLTVKPFSRSNYLIIRIIEYAQLESTLGLTGKSKTEHIILKWV